MTLHVNDPLAPEVEKYRAIWEQEAYHERSPGLDNVDRFFETIKLRPGETLIDIGCGAGVAGLEFERRGLMVTFLDIVNVLGGGHRRKRAVHRLPVWVRGRT